MNASEKGVSRRQLLGLVGLSLVGCGGGGSDAPMMEKPAALMNPTAPTPRKIACCGDSTMWGSTLQNGSYVQSPNNMPAVIQRLLPNDVVTNLGVPGSTTDEWLWGLNQITQTWANRMTTSDADLFLINTGINDSFLVGFTVTDYIYAYGQFAGLARNAGKQIVFVTPNPINDVHNTLLWDFQHALKAKALEWGVPVIDQYNMIAQLPNWQAMVPDNIHPNDSLYLLMGQYAAASL